MNKYSTKIFQVDSSLLKELTTKKFINDLIGNHNSNKSHNQYIQVETNGNDFGFDEHLYVHHPTPTNPSWLGMIKEIARNTKDVKDIRSKYPSFLLFLHRHDEIFIVTGGAGYRVVDGVLDSQFGFKAYQVKNPAVIKVYLRQLPKDQLILHGRYIRRRVAHEQPGNRRRMFIELYQFCQKLYSDKYR